MWGVMEVTDGVFGELVPDPLFLPPGLMLSALASCHSVALLGGQALGDPLELKMIESTGWVMTAFVLALICVKHWGYYEKLFRYHFSSKY